MTLKANRVTWLRRTVLSQGSQGSGGGCPPGPLPPPRVARGDRARRLPGFEAPKTGDHACVPASVAAARRRLLTTSTGTVRGSLSRGGRPCPSARAPCRPPRPLRAGALRGGVTAPPGNVSVRAPVRARGHGAGRRARCRCVAWRATALKARVLHARAWKAARGVPPATPNRRIYRPSVASKVRMDSQEPGKHPTWIKADCTDWDSWRGSFRVRLTEELRQLVRQMKRNCNTKTTLEKL